MDVLAEHGSRWFCAAAHALGTATFEMQTCGDTTMRYGIGIATVAAAMILAVLAIWRLGERSAR